MAGAKGGVVPFADAQRSVRLRDPHPLSAVRGQALIALVFMLSVATMLLVYGSTTEVSRAVSADQRTRAVLEQARQALIGRAVGDANRPGSLPCPDSGNDGSADLFIGSSCPTYIGRLPWRSLGIGDLRDESGERLWYALSPNFRDHPSAPPINSDTRGTLAVYSGSESVPMANDAVAVVFAAGSALPGQKRDANPHPCSSSGRIVANNACAANYLDAAGNLSNAGSGGPFLSSPATSAFNDKLAIILTADLMPLVERRVALETRNALLSYREASSCACFPWADENGDGASDLGANRGRLPNRTALPENWPSGTLPAYFVANDWSRVIHYAVGGRALEGGGSGCKTCSAATLSLDEVSGYDVVLVTPGFATGNRQRSTISDYFEDLENRNEDDRFVTPTSVRADRDAVYAIAASTSGCAATARVLADNAPCAQPGGTIRKICRSAEANLSSCTCASAARVLATAPCAGNLGRAECASAFNQLRRCTS